ncbi:hypothetical protein B0O99DRAFT_691259 [Bisporella sp. PMI_857]|nr:hypothetical protein B0O99DRAFT_691259 [Bisporella sp. PMI_857]
MVYIGALKLLSIDAVCIAYIEYRKLLEVRKNFLAQISHALDAHTTLNRFVVPPHAKYWITWLRTAGYTTDVIAETLSLRSKAANFSRKDIIKYPPPFPALIMSFRDQDATDFHDKVYAFYGMALKEYAIPVDYNMSKRKLYTRVARSLFRRVLIPLLWVESHNRPVTSTGDIPSWVPDYTIKQGFIPRSYVSTHTNFYADKAFTSIG